MADKTYPHALFEVAHPTVSTLIRQAVEIRKFQLIFPELFGVLQWARYEMREALKKWLINLLKEKREDLNERELIGQLATIIFERRLLDKVIVYITTGKIDYDEYVTQNLVTTEKYLEFFQLLKAQWDVHLSHYFETRYDQKEYFQSVDFPNGERKCSAMDAVFNVIEKNGWYLPNLLVDWDVKSLFADYYVLFLEYHIYTNKTKKKAAKITREPTVKEAFARLEILLKRYPLPFPYERGSNMLEDEFSDIGEKFLNLKFNIKSEIHFLPKLLESFILNLQSRKIDIFKGGVQDNFINQNDLEFQRTIKLSKELLDAFNPILNKNNYLDRADSLISALAMLIYMDEVFYEFYLNKEIMRDWQDYNISIIQYSGLKHENIINYLEISRKKRNELIVNIKKVDYSKLFKELVAALELRSDNLIVTPVVKKTINKIQVTLKETGYTREIQTRSLKTSINKMIQSAFTNDEEKAKTDQSLDPFGLGDIFTVVISGRSSR